MPKDTTPHPKCSCGKPATTLQIDELPKRKEHVEAGPAVELDIITLSDVAKLPKRDPRTRWTFRCMDCGESNPVYWIPLHRISTYAQALDWTIHLAGREVISLASESWGTALATLFPEVQGKA